MRYLHHIHFLAIVALLVRSLPAAYVYVDATPSNTTLDGSALVARTTLPGLQNGDHLDFTVPLQPRIFIRQRFTSSSD